MFDLHTHTDYSHDGKESLKSFVSSASAKGIEILAVTEHADRDYIYSGGMERLCGQLDIEAYRKGFEKVREITAGIELLFGIECGYSRLASRDYETELPNYDFDIIINSVHTVFGRDVYFKNAFFGRTPEQVISEYLRVLLESVEARYDYDVIGHIGYVSRYVPEDYANIYTEKYIPIIDEILKAVIARDKCLELNTNIKTLRPPCIPSEDILKRYAELGGKKISYGSDAHVSARLGEGFTETKELAKKYGFTHFTGYRKRKPFEIPIE